MTNTNIQLQLYHNVKTGEQPKDEKSLRGWRATRKYFLLEIRKFSHPIFIFLFSPKSQITSFCQQKNYSVKDNRSEVILYDSQISFLNSSQRKKTGNIYFV